MTKLEVMKLISEIGPFAAILLGIGMWVCASIQLGSSACCMAAASTLATFYVSRNEKESPN